MLPISRQTGFTLVELVACIVILGIIVVVTGPKLFENTSLGARTYSNEIAAALREAQSIAAASNCEVAVTLNATNYMARQRSATGTRCNPAGTWSVNVVRADGTPLAGAAPANVSLSPATVIVFDNRGRRLSSAPVSLGIGAYRIDVQAVSGLVTQP